MNIRKINSLSYFLRKFRLLAKTAKWKLCNGNILTILKNQCPLNFICTKAAKKSFPNGINEFYPYVDKDIVDKIWRAADNCGGDTKIRTSLLKSCKLI